jgi:hypothetical protein
MPIPRTIRPFALAGRWRPTADTRRPSASGRVTPLSPEALGASLSCAITRAAYETIAGTIGQRPAETGAVLGGSRAHGLITHVHLDATAAVSASTYAPDSDGVNRLLRDAWNPAGIDFMGFVHSHPRSCTRPSPHDGIYAAHILAALPKLDRMALPIVQTVPDAGGFRMEGFVALRGATASTARRRRDRETTRIVDAPLVLLDDAHWFETPRPNPFLERVLDAYDQAAMASTRLIAVGVGGSAGYLETMARAGIGQFVLVDPDTTEPSNVGTQAVDPGDIGRPKVDALAARLARLNPNAHIWTIQAADQALDDSCFHRLLREPLPAGPNALPALALLCAFTDSFRAQDRVHRLGLHFGVPTLAAAVHREGRATDLAFAAPGLTRACLRCAQSVRYRGVLQEGAPSAVASDGTPLLATDRLNAAKQVPTLALIHTLNPAARADHPATRRWRAVMDRLRDRNLALTRLDPDSGLPSFQPLDAVADGRCVIDETVWTRPAPDGPDAPGGACPDCGGSGDLADCVGAFRDTRLMPEAFGSNRRG